jgi:hypothetical protein
VAWKQGHVVEVVRYRQIWLDQADAEVRRMCLLFSATAVAAAAAAIIGRSGWTRLMQRWGNAAAAAAAAAIASVNVIRMMSV